MGGGGRKGCKDGKKDRFASATLSFNSRTLKEFNAKEFDKVGVHLHRCSDQFIKLTAGKYSVGCN